MIKLQKNGFTLADNRYIPSFTADTYTRLFTLIFETSIYLCHVDIVPISSYGYYYYFEQREDNPRSYRVNTTAFLVIALAKLPKLSKVVLLHYGVQYIRLTCIRIFWYYSFELFIFHYSHDLVSQRHGRLVYF